MMESENKFSPLSKVWIYQSSRPFTNDEVEMLNISLQNFANQWTAHNVQLKAVGKVIEDRMILLMVDESGEHASGCSIDTSIHFIKSLEQKLGTTLFDRTVVNYKTGNNIQTTQLNQLADLYASSIINDETLVYDSLVNSAAQFESEFIKPVSKSWMKDFL